MERAVTGSLRRCLGSGASSGRALRCTKTTRNVCVATSICPARTSSLSTRAKEQTRAPPALQRRFQNSTAQSLRLYSTAESTPQASTSSSQQTPTPPEHLDAKEREIWQTLMNELQCSSLEVQDISGGCGSMYGIDIVSEKFRGLSMLKQQRLVNQVLGEEIKGWHGVQLKTRAP